MQIKQYNMLITAKIRMFVVMFYISKQLDLGEDKDNCLVNTADVWMTQ